MGVCKAHPLQSFTRRTTLAGTRATTFVLSYLLLALPPSLDIPACQSGSCRRPGYCRLLNFGPVGGIWAIYTLSPKGQHLQTLWEHVRPVV